MSLLFRCQSPGHTTGVSLLSDFGLERKTMKTVWNTYLRVSPDGFVCVSGGRDGSSCGGGGQDGGGGDVDWGVRHHLGIVRI